MKKGKKAIIISCSIIIVLASVITYYYFGNLHLEFFKSSQAIAEIPGLSDGYVPQGMCYVDNHDKILVSSYSSNANELSRIYMIDATTNKVEKWFTISNVSEQTKKSHFCGISSHNNTIWLATDNLVLKTEYDKLSNAQNGGEISITSQFDPKLNTDFCYANESYLIVGEFYREGNYETNLTHHFETADNTTNKALAFVYEIQEGNAHDIKSTTPIKAISMPNQVQGFCLTATNQIVLSTSYSIPDSIFYVYNSNAFNSAPTQTATINSLTLPLIMLDNDVLEEKFSAPSMSEGIDYVDGKIYILFESACNKYKMVTRNRLTDIYAYSL